MTRRLLPVATVVLLVFPSIARGGATVRSAAGASPASIQATVDQFRADLGGANNGAGGTFATGRREINWDGVPDNLSSPNNLPANFFNSNSARGIVFSTPGNAGERVFRVRIRSGDVALGPNDNPAGGDVVAMDDFIYGEPQNATAGCTTDASSLCLLGGRFKVQATFRLPTNPAQLTAHATGIASDSGAFWFLSDNNLELLVKVLDGRALNAKYWVFIGSASGLEYTITVTDTTTGAVKTYFTAFGSLASTADTSAF
jgi:hypothetical protein